NAHPVPSGSAARRLPQEWNDVAVRSLAGAWRVYRSSSWPSRITQAFSMYSARPCGCQGTYGRDLCPPLAPYHSVYPTLNASTGLMDAARLAGMIPAMAADTASVAAAATITVKFTLVIP